LSIAEQSTELRKNLSDFKMGSASSLSATDASNLSFIDKALEQSTEIIFSPEQQQS
jgi:hypothetical protein